MDGPGWTSPPDLALIVSLLKHCRRIDKALLEASGRIDDQHFKLRLADVPIGVKDVPRSECVVPSAAEIYRVLNLDFGRSGNDVERLILSAVAMIRRAATRVSCRVDHAHGAVRLRGRDKNFDISGMRSDNLSWRSTAWHIPFPRFCSIRGAPALPDCCSDIQVTAIAGRYWNSVAHSLPSSQRGAGQWTRNS
jgi:hypothetical protein